MDCTIYVAETKALMSAVIAQLICGFVFFFAGRGSNEVAYQWQEMNRKPLNNKCSKAA